MKIWKQKFELSDLNAMRKNTISDVIDFNFTEIGDDYIIGTMPVNNNTKQPFGILHGGVSVVMAETLGSVASYLCIKDITKENAVGIEVNANHLRSVSKGLVYGKVTPIRVGRKLHVWQIEIVDERNKLICSSKLTTMIIPINK